MTRLLDSNAARILAYIFAAIGLGFIGFEIATLLSLNRDLYCATTDLSCARDWIGATSGWAAAGAAVLSVLAILAQVRQIERHHQLAADREASELDRVSTKAFNIAHGIMEEAVGLEGRVKQTYNVPSPSKDGFLAGAMDSIRTQVANQDLDEYETKLGDSRDVRDRLIKQLGYLQDLFTKRGFSEPYDFATLEPAIAEFMKDLEPLATLYFRKVGTVHLERLGRKSEADAKVAADPGKEKPR
jgi:hypothetical protein